MFMGYTFLWCSIYIFSIALSTINMENHKNIWVFPYRNMIYGVFSIYSQLSMVILTIAISKTLELPRSHGVPQRIPPNFRLRSFGNRLQRLLHRVHLRSFGRNIQWLDDWCMIGVWDIWMIFFRYTVCSYTYAWWLPAKIFKLFWIFVDIKWI